MTSAGTTETPRPFRLLVDGQGIQGEGRRRGVGRYARELLGGIARVRPQWRVQLAVATHLGELDAPAGVETLRYDPPARLDFCDGPATDLLRLHFADWLAAQAPDAVLVLSPFEAGGVPIRFVGGGGPAFLAVMHDLIPLLFPDFYLFGHPGNGRFYPRQLRQVVTCDAAFSNSAATRSDLLAVSPTLPVTNIRGAVASDFPRHDPAAARAIVAELFARKGVAVDPDGGFLLYVGGGDARKNLESYFTAYARLPRTTRVGRPLVIAGEIPGGLGESLRAAAAAAGVGDAVVFLGFVTDVELAALYQVARLFVFPSLYEGLGLPVLEALWCGADVATAGTSSIPEYSGPGTVYFDPADRTDMAAATYRALHPPAHSDPAPKRAFAEAFTWDRSAEAACPGIEAAAARRHREPTATRIVWRRSFAAGTTADDLRLFCEMLNSVRGDDLVVMRLPGDPPLPSPLVRRLRARSPDELGKVEELAPTAVYVYDLDTEADLHAAARWLVCRPGLLIVSAGLAASEVWADPRFAAGLAASDRVLVRGTTERPPRFAAAGRDGDFARLFAEAEAVGRDPDRRWRNAAVAALAQVPPLADDFLAGWAALRVAARAAEPRTTAQ